VEFRSGLIYTTAPRSRDYTDTERLAIAGRLPGGERMEVHLVRAARPIRQAQLYWATDHLAASERRWQRLVARRQVVPLRAA
jgi:hypothetical protein